MTATTRPFEPGRAAFWAGLAAAARKAFVNPRPKRLAILVVEQQKQLETKPLINAETGKNEPQNRSFRTLPETTVAQANRRDFESCFSLTAFDYSESELDFCCVPSIFAKMSTQSRHTIEPGCTREVRT
jgi:hypothetical protein